MSENTLLPLGFVLRGRTIPSIFLLFAYSTGIHINVLIIIAVSTGSGVIPGVLSFLQCHTASSAVETYREAPCFVYRFMMRTATSVQLDADCVNYILGY